MFCWSNRLFRITWENFTKNFQYIRWNYTQRKGQGSSSVEGKPRKRQFTFEIPKIPIYHCIKGIRYRSYIINDSIIDWFDVDFDGDSQMLTEDTLRFEKLPTFWLPTPFATLRYFLTVWLMIQKNKNSLLTYMK